MADFSEPQVAMSAADEAMTDAVAHNTVTREALVRLDVDSSSGRDSVISLPPSTISVASSVYEFVEENGRTYHAYKEGKYVLPNDETEQQRLDIQHHLWVLTLNEELILAPIKDPQHVLDFGTGTGIWAIEFANKYPNAQVLGSDLSPMQPDYLPPNVRFEIDDFDDEWEYNQKFDLIHGRAMVACLHNPARVFASAFSALAPNGWLEIQDLVLPIVGFDDTIHGTTLETWTQRRSDAVEKLGMTWKHPRSYKKFMEEAGFIDVVENHFQWPIGPWPKGQHMKTLGRYFQADLLKGLEGMSMRVLTRGGGMTREEILELCAKVRKDIFDPSIHAYLPVIVVYGRKPA